MQSGQNVHTHNKTVKSHGDTNKWSLLNDTGAINKVTLRTRNHVEAELECDCSPFGNGFLKFWRTAERANPATEIRVLFELKKCCVNRARKILLALRSHRRRKRLFFFLSRFFFLWWIFSPSKPKMGSVAVKHNPPKLIEKRHQTGIYMHACLCRAKTMNE